MQLINAVKFVGWVEQPILLGFADISKCELADQLPEMVEKAKPNIINRSTQPIFTLNG